MKKSIASALAFSVMLGLFFGCSSSNSEKTLFLENSDSWFIEGDSKWKFINGELHGVADSTAGSIMTKKKYQNFELVLEFKPDSTINSGIFVHCDQPEISATECHELNIWDLHPNQDYRTGAIVTKVKPYVKVETLNKWNSYRAVTKNGAIEVYVNDVLTASISKDTLREGYIGLQAMGRGTIKFKNVRLKE